MNRSVQPATQTNTPVDESRPTSILEVRNWQEDLVPVFKTRPQLFDYFTTNYNQSEILKDLNCLRYMDDEAELDARKLETKYRAANLSNSLVKVPEENEAFLERSIGPYRLDNFYGNAPIVTFSNVVARIMNTPFEIHNSHRRWHIKAKFIRGVIHLIDVEAGKSKYSRSYDLLKKHMFLMKPLYCNRDVTSLWDDLFYEVYQMKIGENNLMYVAEIPGVKSEQKLTKYDDLASAEHVFCAAFYSHQLSKELLNYNPMWWAEGELLNAKQYCIGRFSEDNQLLQEIYKFNVDRFNDATNYVNLWSQIGAWNFLDRFLAFVKTEIVRIKPEVRELCCWNFKSYQNGQPFVSCEAQIRDHYNQLKWKPVEVIQLK